MYKELQALKPANICYEYMIITCGEMFIAKGLDDLLALSAFARSWTSQNEDDVGLV
jgi:hypothetical protein